MEQKYVLPLEMYGNNIFEGNIFTVFVMLFTVFRAEKINLLFDF